jgi:hypothetical protein
LIQLDRFTHSYSFGTRESAPQQTTVLSLWILQVCTAPALTRLARLHLLAIDDWLLAPLKAAERHDLLEVIEERSENASTLVASQLPVKDWHTGIGDPNQADAPCACSRPI